ncbi:MAG: hypothetical protein ACP5LI_07745 [Hydrogenobaculum sp.]
MKKFHLIIRIKHNNQIIWQTETEAEGTDIGNAINLAFRELKMPYTLGGLFERNLHLEFMIFAV